MSILFPYFSLQGMRTYDYILAMREAAQSFDSFDDSGSSSSDESIGFDSPERLSFDPFDGLLQVMFDSNKRRKSILTISFSISLLFRSSARVPY